MRTNFLKKVDIENIEHNEVALAKDVVAIGKTSGGSFVPILVDGDGIVQISPLIWQRSGTTISPVNAGDDLDMGTGSISANQAIIGDQTASDSCVQFFSETTLKFIFGWDESRGELIVAEQILDGTQDLLTFAPTEIILNNPQRDRNVRMASVNNTAMFIMDALNDRIGINEAAPQDTLEVNGTVMVKDKLKFTQDDGLEYIDSEADGDLDLAATNNIDFNIGGNEIASFDAEGFKVVGPTAISTEISIIDYATSVTYTGGTNQNWMHIGGTLEVDSSSIIYSAIKFDATISTGSSLVVGIVNLFNADPTLEIDIAGKGFVPTIFFSHPTLNANNVASGTILSSTQFLSQPNFRSEEASGDLTVTTSYGFFSNLILTTASDAGAQVTLATHYDFHVNMLTDSGVGTNIITTRAGLHVEDLIKGENIYGMLVDGLSGTGAINAGIWLGDISGATDDYGIVLDSDDSGGGAIWFGAGQDAKIYFNGSELIIDSSITTATDELNAYTNRNIIKYIGMGG